MKITHYLSIALFALLLLAFSQSFASGSNIMGQVTDTSNNKPLADAVVILQSQGQTLTFFTNEHGYYYASNIPAGSYIVGVTNLGKTYQVSVNPSPDETREINFMVGGTVLLGPITVSAGVSKKPLLDKFEPTRVILDEKDIKMTLALNVSSIAETQPGIVAVDGQVYVHGARAGSLTYYIDGCKVMGSPDIPLCGLSTYSTYIGY
ncbi:MAG TPA: carboxypeptidase regulatory-like domain-containing protein, partial [Chitinophagales bacterium]|nr:carboxypeptidase regulatory-like domain-containing protein [Chitinophagales bacterium]